MKSYPMIEWAKDLFPICRSITGDGVRDTIEYFKRINPELKTHSFATGEQVFDWEIPREWKIRDAYLEHESGKRFAEFKKNNLHVLGYSAPQDSSLEKNELLKHIYTQPDQPDLIPYVTSYYKERWGFCLSESDKNALPEGSYRAVIDSELFDGELLICEAHLEGASEKEILFASYFCHPSMANNELSGPVLLNALMRYLKECYPERRMSYRFVMVPETIGTIAFLSRFLDTLKKNVICGFNLSCVGDERAYSHVQSRYGNSLADTALAAALKDLPNVTTYSFLERGSDERQYSAPGVDLPVCSFCRSKWGTYPEYHTDADNFDLVTQAGLEGAFSVMTNLIDAFECGLHPRTTVLGEPQLGKRGLYPTLSQKGSYADIRTRMDVIAYSDGTNSLFEIANLIDRPLKEVVSEVRILKDHGILEIAE
jgi:aminopeptidase-like protein